MQDDEIAKTMGRRMKGVKPKAKSLLLRKNGSFPGCFRFALALLEERSKQSIGSVRHAADELQRRFPLTFVCFLRLSSLTRSASSMVLLSFCADLIGLGTFLLLSTLVTSPVLDHLFRRLSLYSFAAISRPLSMPSFSLARAFHIRTLPSSDPDKTNRASRL